MRSKRERRFGGGLDDGRDLRSTVPPGRGQSFKRQHRWQSKYIVHISSSTSKTNFTQSKRYQRFNKPCVSERSGEAQHFDQRHPPVS